jgi:hypothetical protein
MSFLFTLGRGDLHLRGPSCRKAKNEITARVGICAQGGGVKLWLWRLPLSRVQRNA